jgi:serine/threonine protein phosphatase PrpC
VGDSRAVLWCNRGEEVLPLSQDHTPELAEERQRIEKNGGIVSLDVLETPNSFKKRQGPPFLS